jgi:hypothetical protein
MDKIFLILEDFAFQMWNIDIKLREYLLNKLQWNWLISVGVLLIELIKKNEKKLMDDLIVWGCIKK